ncbi:protein takeout-like isoform X2 [Rhagoletis pomonella]|uniref:protein takeout-like isoform X2 n=1 Tax=Rhagoletis pomonella TaxID=28610 RepID=UPI00177C4C94|nr:protein takeout-like isoform X2 [Rhagoletis pomonella]XP_036343137.1 protein takeout-like isoform X2 [Rhagoletis pomonella]
MEDIIIKQDPANPVAIYLALKNPVVYGTKNIRARKVKGFGKTPDGRHELLLHAPYISMISDYEIDGKVLILPIKGQGKSNITLADDPKPCKFGDDECLLKAVNFYLGDKNQGDSAINLLKIDPLDAGTFTLKQGADNPVNIDLTFIKNKITGVAHAQAYKVRGFGKDLAKKHELRFKVPVASLIGDYKIQGRVLILPISGSGKNNITMLNADFVLQWVGVPVEKDGATYMKTDKFRAIVKPNKVIFDFQNLFNGDKALGDNMNLFLNENWKEIYQEVEATFSKEISRLMGNVVDAVFSKTPYNKLFTE